MAQLSWKGNHQTNRSRHMSQKNPISFVLSRMIASLNFFGKGKIQGEEKHLI